MAQAADLLGRSVRQVRRLRARRTASGSALGRLAAAATRTNPRTYRVRDVVRVGPRARIRHQQAMVGQVRE